MKSRILLPAAAFLVVLTAQPLRGDIDPPRMEVLGVRLVTDATCHLAGYLLLDGCTGTPRLYVTFPGARNVDRFVNNFVTVRGTVEFTTCTLPLMRATRIVEGAPPPCPPLCQPGDPPPCPQEPVPKAAARMPRQPPPGDPV